MQLDNWRRWLPNLVIFHVVWIIAVDGAARGYWWWGPASVAVWAAWELPRSPYLRSDLALMLGTAVLGFALDTLWVQSGLVKFTSPSTLGGIAPLWIVSLWIGFALTLNHSLYPLKTRPVWAGMLGLTGGPLAYWLAQRSYSAVELAAPPWLVLAVLAVAWALVTPLLLVWAKRLESLDAH